MREKKEPLCMMIISIHQNNLLNPSDIYESYNTVIADEFNFPFSLPQI